MAGAPRPDRDPGAIRAGERRPRIVDEYVFDTAAELAPSSEGHALTEGDRQCLIDHPATASLSELEKATLRLIALRSSPSMPHAAEEPVEGHLARDPRYEPLMLDRRQGTPKPLS